MKTTFFCMLIIIMCCECSSEFTRELSGGYFYNYVGPPMVAIIHHTSHKEICSIVIDYDFNDDFIIVAQKPNGKCFKDRDYKIYRNGHGKVYYWIIVHSKDSLLGPFSEPEYLYQRNKYGVPSNFKLDVNKKP